jgi:hypothetical protein
LLDRYVGESEKAVREVAEAIDPVEAADHADEVVIRAEHFDAALDSVSA